MIIIITTIIIIINGKLFPLMEKVTSLPANDICNAMSMQTMEMNNQPTIKSSTAFQKCNNMKKIRYQIQPLINRVGLSLWGAAMVAVKQRKMLIYI